MKMKKYTVEQLKVLKEMTFVEFVKEMTGFTLQQIEDHANCAEGFAKVLTSLASNYTDMKEQ